MTMNRRHFLAGLAGAVLPLPALAQSATIHELSGEVLLNGYRMAPNSAILPGQTVQTGRDGLVWFTIAGDAFFLRPGSELRLGAPATRGALIDTLRLISGALGATFNPGRRRSVVARTATIGIRGTGVYVETNREETYACTCFGATEMISTASGAMMEGVQVTAQNHLARRIHRDPVMGMRIAQAPFERHTSEEITRLERLAGRPNPFRA
jgi:hypothetical protein